MQVESTADMEQLQSSLKERESQVASLEEELKQLREEQGKSANAVSLLFSPVYAHKCVCVCAWC